MWHSEVRFRHGYYFKYYSFTVTKIFLLIYKTSSRHVARMEDSRSALKILTGKHTGKRPLGKCWLRWEDNIRINLKETISIGGIWLI